MASKSLNAARVAKYDAALEVALKTIRTRPKLSKRFSRADIASFMGNAQIYFPPSEIDTWLTFMAVFGLVEPLTEPPEYLFWRIPHNKNAN